MNVSSGEGSDDRTMSDINVTPMVDVMLVLLIIFLITIPVITQTAKVDLPKIANQPTQTKPENITIAVSADGDIFWNTAKLPDEGKLRELIRSVAMKQPQPEIHIRGDKAAKYEYVGRVILAVQRGGIVKVGFITEPDRGFR